MPVSYTHLDVYKRQVNAKADQKDIDATLEFLNWVITSDDGRDAIAVSYTHLDVYKRQVFDNGISDDTFAKICSLIRISVPYTGMISSTRESQTVREKVLPLGVSQISGASKTSVGGYAAVSYTHLFQMLQKV